MPPAFLRFNSGYKFLGAMLIADGDECRRWRTIGGGLDGGVFIFGVTRPSRAGPSAMIKDNLGNGFRTLSFPFKMAHAQVSFADGKRVFVRVPRAMLNDQHVTDLGNVDVGKWQNTDWQFRPDVDLTIPASTSTWIDKFTGIYSLNPIDSLTEFICDKLWQKDTVSVLTPFATICVYMKAC